MQAMQYHGSYWIWFLSDPCLVVVRTRSPIDWYHYTAYNLAVNLGDDYVFAEREVYRNRLSNLALALGPTMVYRDGWVR